MRSNLILNGLAIGIALILLGNLKGAQIVKIINKSEYSIYTSGNNTSKKVAPFMTVNLSQDAGSFFNSFTPLQVYLNDKLIDTLTKSDSGKISSNKLGELSNISPKEITIEVDKSGIVTYK